jgi:hypothetical protein
MPEFGGIKDEQIKSFSPTALVLLFDARFGDAYFSVGQITPRIAIMPAPRLRTKPS